MCRKEVKKIEKNKKFLDENLVNKLKEITKLFETNIELAIIKGENQEETEDIIQMSTEIAATSEKISVSVYEKDNVEILDKGIDLTKLPAVVILNENKEFSRIKYTAVPTGHELSSFILAMYNVSGPGQKLTDEILGRIKKLNKKINIKLGVVLNCTRCPDTVQSSQRIAVENKNIDVEIIDVFSHKDFKTKYDIINVPAMVINNSKLYFGQLSIEEVLEILEQQ